MYWFIIRGVLDIFFSSIFCWVTVRCLLRSHLYYFVNKVINILWKHLKGAVSKCYTPSQGGSHIDMVYVYMCLPFGKLFHEIWYSDRGFSSEIEEPKLHKLGVFWENKKHRFGQNYVILHLHKPKVSLNSF